MPTEPGDGGASHADVCDVLREVARRCGSTALALSTPQHLVATHVWNHRLDRPGEALLRRVADRLASFRDAGLERLVRDLHGAQVHPLPEKSQLRLSGRLALGLEPTA